MVKKWKATVLKSDGEHWQGAMAGMVLFAYG